MAGKSSLRDRHKSRRRAQVLAAGKELFVRQGYAATSMQAIAEAAEVGIATVYNYFGSKGRLLAGILRADFDQLFERGAALLAQPPEDPAAGVLGIIDLYRQFEGNWEARDMLAAVIGPGLSADPALDEVARDAEHRVKKQLGDLLSHYQKARRIRREIDVNDASVILFYVFNQHFIEYVTGESADFAVMKREMDRQLRFIVTAIRQ